MEFSQQSLKAAFHFFRISTGHAHFLNGEICISWVPMKPSTVFFSCTAPEKSTRKAGLEVCGWPLHLVLSTGKETHLQVKAYLYASHLEALFSLHFLYTGCFYHFKHKTNRQTNIQTYKQTNIQTHTHFSENNFRKPGAPS